MEMDYQLWKDKGKRELDPLLFSEKADVFARKIANEGKEIKDKQIKQAKNKSSQVRRYFDEVIRLNTIAKDCTDDEELKYRVLPQLHMLISKVAYARGRGLITSSFENMIKNGIKQVKDREDLQVFTNFLEAFIGFYKGYVPK